MGRQLLLFPEPAITVQVARGRREPALWVRRLVLWRRPGEVLREVTLRRGLNIVWSPDPSAAQARGAPGGSGHGVGKTLFCRLLRYCLGEETFANDALRDRVLAAFPDALVGAEVMLGGKPWGIVRPLGASKRAVVTAGVTPEELLERGERGTGMEPFLAAVHERLLPADIVAHMPGTREGRTWLYALAWLARDQECRLAHLLEWRHPRADTRTPVPRLSKAELLTVVRLFLEVLSSDELDTRGRLRDVASGKQSMERERGAAARAATRIADRLLPGLGLDPGLLATGPLAAVTALRLAEERLAAAEARLDASDFDGASGNASDDASGATTSGAASRARLQAELEAALGELAVARAGLATAEAGACAACGVHHDPAPAHGERLAARAAELEARARGLREAIAAAEQAAAARRRALRQPWLDAARLVDEARRFDEACADIERAQQRAAALVEDEIRCKEALQVQREQHGAALRRLEELFRHVCQELLGADADAALSLTEQGLRAQAQIGGSAMESLQVIAFDLAALLMSLEGRSLLPAFVIHDSPREADLGLSLYHKLFRFMARLEALGKEPPFQYIVTTTTEPPDELRASPFLVAALGGADEQRLLLKRAL